MRLRVNWKRRAALAALAAAMAVAWLWQPALRGMAHFMAAPSPLAPADAIVPLYDDADTVPGAVAELLRRGLASRVVLHRRKPGRLESLRLVAPAHRTWQQLLLAEGIRAEQIEIVGHDVEDKIQLGRTLAGLRGSAERLRLIVVASSPRSRLSRHALRQGIGGEPVEVLMHPVTPTGISNAGWWHSRAGVIAYFDAYCLWIVNWLR